MIRIFDFAGQHFDRNEYWLSGLGINERRHAVIRHHVRRRKHEIIEVRWDVRADDRFCLHWIHDMASWLGRDVLTWRWKLGRRSPALHFNNLGQSLNDCQMFWRKPLQNF